MPCEVTVLPSGGFLAEHDALALFGYGDDEVDALTDFMQTTQFQWEHLVEVDEVTLTEGGRARRQAFLSAVQRRGGSS